MAAHPQQLGLALSEPPADSITRLRWTSSSRLLATSWDSTLRVYDAAGSGGGGGGGASVAALSLDAPALDCCVEPAGGDAAAAYVGLVDGGVQRIDLERRQALPLGRHDGGRGARCVEWLPEHNVLASAGWDAALRYWDARAPPGAACVARVALPGRAHAMAAAQGRLVVATAGRQLLVLGVGSGAVPLGAPPPPARESSLKYQTRALAACGASPLFAVGCVEGRVAMEPLLPDVPASAKFAFKCHRQRAADGADVPHPVHALAFHPAHGTFATGGGDGAVALWCGASKKRLAHWGGYRGGVSSLAFSPCGGLLAVAQSHCFERGELLAARGEEAQEEEEGGGGGCDAPRDAAVFVRRVADSEVRPKARGK